MRRILVTSLSVHWAVAFLLLAVEAGNLAMAPAWGGEKTPVAWGAAALAAALLLVSLTYVWAGVSGLVADNARRQGEASEVALLALAAAATALTGAAIAGHAGTAILAPAHLAALLAALAASHMVCRVERIGDAIRVPGRDPAREAARLMAAGAAHNSALSAISGRRPKGPEGTG